jgi:hypothetical protein
MDVGGLSPWRHYDDDEILISMNLSLDIAAYYDMVGYRVNVLALRSLYQAGVQLFCVQTVHPDCVLALFFWTDSETCEGSNYFPSRSLLSAYINLCSALDLIFFEVHRLTWDLSI